MQRATATASAVLLLALSLGAGVARADGHTLAADVHSFRLVDRESGEVDYYRVMDDGSGSFMRAEYKPGWDTAVHAFKIPDGERRTYKKLHWRWRALKIPAAGNECVKDRADSVAAVYATWKRGLKWYTAKFVWSPTVAAGTACDHKGAIFFVQQTIVLQSGGPVNEWRSAEVDLDDTWRRYFGNGDPHAEVPDFVGVGMMTDGDQTNSEAAADYGGFVLSEK